MPRKYKRDPHLPPPEVCDWLLSQKWEGPSTVELRTSAFTATQSSSLYASAALGRDHVVEVFLDVDAHDALKEDARARIALDWLAENNP
jgi:hypothetical protein